MTSQQFADLLLQEHQEARRERRLAEYYAAERNAGVPALIANERMHFHAKYMDEYERDLEVIKRVMERT
jgi:hypothetical protein